MIYKMKFDKVRYMGVKLEHKTLFLKHDYIAKNVESC